MSPDIPVAAIATILATLITGTITFIGLLISKEAKTSEFRQQWIDALRVDIADIVSHANSIHGGMIGGASRPPEVVWASVGPHYTAINRAAAAIRLRLNPDEDQSIAVIAELETLEALLNPAQQALDWRALDQVERAFVAKAQKLLKSEWKRVRNGELTFRTVKWIAATIAICATVTGVGYLYVVTMG